LPSFLDHLWLARDNLDQLHQSIPDALQRQLALQLTRARRGNGQQQIVERFQRAQVQCREHCSRRGVNGRRG
jgi:hypothetical protein